VVNGVQGEKENKWKAKLIFNLLDIPGELLPLSDLRPI